MVGGEEVDGATNASDRDFTQKGGSCPAYRRPVQWETARESRDGSDQSGGEWPGEEAPPSKEEECGGRDQRKETEIVAFVKQPVIVEETFSCGKGHLNSDISNLASKASEWLSTRVCSGGSCIVAIAVDHLIKGDHLVSPPLGSAPLVRAFDWSSGKVWMTSRALAAR